MAKPEKLPANQFDHFYKGGNRIGALRGGPGGPMRPEEWIGSTTTRFGEKSQGLSVLSDGRYLKDAIESSPEEWLGAEHIAAYSSSIEVLVKLLDPDQRLPVHFHPNRKFAKDHLSLNHGKTEAWIILEAPAKATVGLGFKEEMKKSTVAELVEQQDSAALLASLKSVEVEAGDSIFVPAGTPHAIDAGIFVLELQEPTDLSALLEWTDFAVDGVKDGHLDLGFDTVLDALNFSPIPASEIEKLVMRERISGGHDLAVFSDVANPYFRADYISGANSILPAGFGIFLALGGAGEIRFSNAPALSVNKGDAIVIPFSAGDATYSGVSGVLSRPPMAAFAGKGL
jgi:mannose-6-phosphate isomerase